MQNGLRFHNHLGNEQVAVVPDCGKSIAEGKSSVAMLRDKVKRADLESEGWTFGAANLGDAALSLSR